MDSFKKLTDLPPTLVQPLKYSLILTGTITVLSVSTLFFLQPELPIFYSLPLSSQQIVPRYWILLFPGLAFSITVLHIVLIGIFKHVEEEVLRLFCWMTVLIQMLLLAILVRLLVLVI